MFPLDAMPDRGSDTRKNLVGTERIFISFFRSYLSRTAPIPEMVGQRFFAARSAVAAKYRAKSLTKNRWGRRVGPAIKFAKRILVRRGNHSDGDVIDLKPTL